MHVFNTPVKDKDIFEFKPIFHPVFFILSEENLGCAFMCVYVCVYIYIHIYIYMQKCVCVCVCVA